MCEGLILFNELSCVEGVIASRLLVNDVPSAL
jgi:hypothetical protein